MQYRVFPKIPEKKISALGFGCMRFATKDNSPAIIDEEISTPLLLEAFENGVNYFDTAWPYHQGQSELFVGKALQSVRQNIFFATKCPVWLIHTKDDWEKYLNDQLIRLKTDYIDFYLLHALDKDSWEKVLKLDGLAILEKAKKEGKIRHIGFSFHDSLDCFKTIIDGYDWDFTQVQFNYMDTHFQAGLEGIKYAADKEIGVIVMEGLRGGSLAKDPPKPVKEIFALYEKPRMPAEWALRYILDRQEVITVLSGMSTLPMLWENIAVANSARMNSMTKKEYAIIDGVKAFYESKAQVPCTTCGYCMPCPQGVLIPDTFSSYNSAHMYDEKDKIAHWYKISQINDKTSAENCIRCGQCEPKCPQKIKIMDKLAEAHNYLIH